MKTKDLMVAALVVTSSFVMTTAACSSDDETAKGFSCPKAGDKPCPNDPGTTQITADTCARCEAEYRAYDACLGGAKCTPAGKTEEPGPGKCPDELDKVIRCIQGGSAATDGGSGG